MKHIIAINGSPRAGWNTDILVQEAAAGAASQGAEVEVIQLYRLEKFTGCVSCFACKSEASLGKCSYKDGLTEVLEKIRQADGLILGTPNYLGDVSAGFRALYERLIFQYITYKKEPQSYSSRKIPAVFIMTSNAPEEFYTPEGYGGMVEGYQKALSGFIGPTQVLISGNTLQVNDYEKYDWTMFDVEKKKERREQVFPKERQAAFALGAGLVK